MVGWPGCGVKESLWWGREEDLGAGGVTPSVLFLLKDLLKGFSVALVFGLSALGSWGRRGPHHGFATSSELHHIFLQASVSPSSEWGVNRPHCGYVLCGSAVGEGGSGKFGKSTLNVLCMLVE